MDSLVYPTCTVTQTRVCGTSIILETYIVVYEKVQAADAFADPRSHGFIPRLLTRRWLWLHGVERAVSTLSPPPSQGLPGSPKKANLHYSSGCSLLDTTSRGSRRPFPQAAGKAISAQLKRPTWTARVSLLCLPPPLEFVCVYGLPKESSSGENPGKPGKLGIDF